MQVANIKFVGRFDILYTLVHFKDGSNTTPVVPKSSHLGSKCHLALLRLENEVVPLYYSRPPPQP